MNTRTIKLWNRIERKLKHKFPKEIKSILSVSGFDCELSLKEINEKTIKKIEQFVTENIAANKLEIIEALKDTPYEGKALPFQFLFGHKLLISSLPEKIDKINEKRVRKNQNPIEIRDPEEQKKNLLLKLKKYAEKFHLNFVIQENDIKRFVQQDLEDKCVVKCPFCVREIPCTYNSHWQISNLTKHINTHSESRNQSASQSKDQNSAGNSSANPSANQSVLPRVLPINKLVIRRAQGPNVLAEVQNIL